MVLEGFGRLNAQNRIGNTVFADGMGIRRNRVATTAPVAYPHLWDVHWFSWVQYNGSIERPMVRDAGGAMGVGVAVNFQSSHDPGLQFEHSHRQALRPNRNRPRR